jgi:NO-binding membrane sensor protein with MHYT domain
MMAVYLSHNVEITLIAFVLALSGLYVALRLTRQ